MGTYFLVNDGKEVPVLTAEGKATLLPEQDAIKAIQEGKATADTSEDTRKKYGIRTFAKEDVLADAPVAATTMGALQGISLGGAGVVAGLAGEDSAKAFRELKEYNPEFLAGEIGGSVGSAFVGGMPLNALARGAAKVIPAGASTLGKVASAAAKGAAVSAPVAMGHAASDVATAPIEMSATDAAGHIVESGLKGAALGAGLSIAGLGLGALARFGSQKAVTGLENAGQRAKLIKQRNALQKELAATESKGPIATSKTLTPEQIGRATSAEKALHGIEDALAAIPKSKVGWLVGQLAERKMAALVGGLVGGLPGAAAGWVVAPKMVGAIQAAARPAVAAGAPVAAKAVSGLSSAARAASPIAGPTIQRESVKTLTAKEFTDLAEQVQNATPEAAEVQVSLDLEGVPAPVRKEIARNAVQQVEFFREKVGRVVPKKDINNPFEADEKPPDPGMQARIRLTRYARAVADPESIVRDFAYDRLTPEAVEAGDRLYPAEMGAFRRLVLDTVKQEVAQGKKYSFKEQSKIAMLLGTRPRTTALLPYHSPNSQQQEQRQPAPNKTTEGLDVVQLTRLQSIMAKGNA